MEYPVLIHLELCADLEAELERISPEKYIKPDFTVISGVKVLGTATVTMKQMWTFWSMQQDRLKDLVSQLRTARETGNDTELKRIAVLFGTNELLLRGVETALGYEVGRHFDAFGQSFGIDGEWKVYIEDVAPLSHVR